MNLTRVLPLASAWLVCSCGALPFDVDQDIAEQRVTGNPNPIAQLFPSLFELPITVDIQAETARRNTGPARSATLKSLTLAATPHGAPSGTFDFLDEVHLYVESPSSSSLTKVEVARLAPVPRGATRLDFTVLDGVDLLPYLAAGARITATASGRQPIKDFTFDGHFVVTVHV